MADLTHGRSCAASTTAPREPAGGRHRVAAEGVAAPSANAGSRRPQRAGSAADARRRAARAQTLDQRTARVAAPGRAVRPCTALRRTGGHADADGLRRRAASTPDICFIGEAPGADEDRLGEPFVGAAGQLLNRIIAACGLNREEVYICNILKCRPPGNRTPKPDEAANCREYLERQLDAGPAEVRSAASAARRRRTCSASTAPLGKLRGRFHDYKGIPVLCTYHPAFLLPHRQPEKKKDVWDDMKTLLKKLGRADPGPSGK